jgi:outer membrane protein
MPIPRLRPPRPLAVALAVSLAALAPLPAAAQSLIQLYDAAHAYDASYLAARALYESAPYRVDQTRALLRPNVSLGATAGEVKAYLDNSPNPHNTSYGVTITGRQPILNRPNSATIAQSERSLVSSLAELDAAEQDLMLRVSQAYFDVLGAQDTLATTRASKAAISEQLASARRNFEVGTATITDTREAQARFDLATAQEIAAENDLRTKRIALDQLVGQSNVIPRQLRVPVVLPVPKSDVEEYVSRAAEEHPSVRRALVAYEVAQLETEKARAQSLPTVDAVASVGNGRGLFQPGLFGQNTSIGVQLNMPIFAGGAIQNRIKETLVLEERARNDLAAARRGVTQTTRQAYYTLLSGAAQVKALEAAEGSSQLALEATQVGYRVGIRVNVDVLNAQSQLFQTRRDLARARYDVLLATLRLRQASGQLTPADVLEIDRLLAP